MNKNIHLYIKLTLFEKLSYYRISLQLFLLGALCLGNDIFQNQGLLTYPFNTSEKIGFSCIIAGFLLVVYRYQNLRFKKVACNLTPDLFQLKINQLVNQQRFNKIDHPFYCILENNHYRLQAKTLFTRSCSERIYVYYTKDYLYYRSILNFKKNFWAIPLGENVFNEKLILNAFEL